MAIFDLFDSSSPGFIFGGNTGLTYDQLQARRKIAEAMIGRRSQYPKNIGEGIASAGESFGNALMLKGLDRDAARAAANEDMQLKTLYSGALGTGTPATSGAAATSIPAPDPGAGLPRADAGGTLPAAGASGPPDLPPLPVIDPRGLVGRGVGSPAGQQYGPPSPASPAAWPGGQLTEVPTDPNSFVPGTFGLPGLPAQRPTPDMRIASADTGTVSDAAPLWLRSGALPAPPPAAPGVLGPALGQGGAIQPAPAEVQTGTLTPPPSQITGPLAPDPNVIQKAPPVSPSGIPIAPSQVGTARPTPPEPYDPGPEPQRPPPTPQMQMLQRMALDPFIRPDYQKAARDKYAELSKEQGEDFRNKWTIWKTAQLKSQDPATRIALTEGAYKAEKAGRDLEGEGFYPLTQQELAQFPNVPPGVQLYKDKYGNLKSIHGPQTVSIDMKAEGKGLEELQKKMADHFIEQFKGATTASDDLQTLADMRALAARVNTGPVAVAKQFAGRWGLKTEGVSDIEALNAAINRIVPQQRVPGTGATSDFDARMFQQAVPQLMNTPDGNMMIMDTMENLARNKLARGEVSGKVISGELNIAQGTKELLRLQIEAKAASDRVRTYLENTGTKLPESIIPSQSEADNAARKWLEANPNHPRANAIRKQLEGAGGR